MDKKEKSTIEDLERELHWSFEDSLMSDLRMLKVEKLPNYTRAWTTGQNNHLRLSFLFWLTQECVRQGRRPMVLVEKLKSNFPVYFE